MYSIYGAITTTEAEFLDVIGTKVLRETEGKQTTKL
jgi:hypothetical protein